MVVYVILIVPESGPMKLASTPPPAASRVNWDVRTVSTLKFTEPGPVKVGALAKPPLPNALAAVSASVTLAARTRRRILGVIYRDWVTESSTVRRATGMEASAFSGQVKKLSRNPKKIFPPPSSFSGGNGIFCGADKWWNQPPSSGRDFLCMLVPAFASCMVIELDGGGSILLSEPAHVTSWC